MKTKQLMDMMRHISPRYSEEAAARAAAAKPRPTLMPALGVTAGALMCTAIIGSAVYAGNHPQDLVSEPPAYTAESAVAAESTTTVRNAESTEVTERATESTVQTGSTERVTTAAAEIVPVVTIFEEIGITTAQSSIAEAVTTTTTAAATESIPATTETSAVTTLTETSIPRTTSETVANREEEIAFVEENWDKLQPLYEEAGAATYQVEDSLVYSIVYVPHGLIAQSYEKGYEPHSREQYEYFMEQLGDTTYRVDDHFLVLKDFLKYACALDYITEEEMFAYCDLVVNQGGKLPDEMISLSTDPEYCRRRWAVFNELFAAKRSEAFYRMLDYDCAFNQMYEKGAAVDQPESLGNDYLFSMFFWFEEE